MTKVRGRSEGVSDAQNSNVPKTMPVLDSGPIKRLIHRNSMFLQGPWAPRETGPSGPRDLRSRRQFNTSFATVERIGRNKKPATDDRRVAGYFYLPEHTLGRASGDHFFGDCEGFGWLPPSRICRHSLSRRS